MKLYQITLAIIVSSLPTFSAAAGIVWSINPAEWKEMADTHSKIDFTGFPHGTVITNQYSASGVVFTNTVFINQGAQYSDGWGLFGNDGVAFTLDGLYHAVAVDYVGAVKFALYNDGVLVGSIGEFVNIPGPFVGIIADVPFDEIYIFKPQPPFSNNIISIDNLYWGMPIPVPGTIALFGIALLGRRRLRL